MSPLPLATAAGPSPLPKQVKQASLLSELRPDHLTGLGRITPPLFQLQSLSTTGTAAYFNVEIWIGCGDQLWLGRKQDHHKTAFSPITALLPGLSNDHAAEKRSPPTRPTLPAHCTQPQLARLPSSRLDHDATQGGSHLESLSSFGVVLWGLLGKGEVLRSSWERERETMMEIRGV